MVEYAKKSCALVLRINHPIQTQCDILKLFLGRGISLSSMHLQCFNIHEGILIIHCLIERDRIKYSVSQLEKILGVIELELLESRAPNPIKI